MTINVINSGLETITQDDISEHKNLKQLYLVPNKIQVIESNTFDKNPLIFALWFNENPIQHIGYNAFKSLNALTVLRFASTRCINQSVDGNRNNVISMMFDLLVKCPPSFEMSREKLLTGVEFQKSVDEQVSDRINPLQWSVFELTLQVNNLLERVVELEKELKS